MSKDMTKPNTVQERFIGEMARQFKAEVGDAIEFDDYHRRLGQHLFIAADKAFRKMREEKGKDITWNNIDMEDFAIKSIHTVNMGLDAFIPNHVHFVPFKNNKTGKYQVVHMPGYKGELYYRLDKAFDPPKRVTYELVYEADKYLPLYSPDGDSYIFDVTSPFNRGDIVGGFGYLSYDDKKKNKVISVSLEKILVAKNAAKTDDFWGRNYEEMVYKTLIRRICSHIEPDPKKINNSFVTVDSARYDSEPIDITPTIEDNANSKPLTPEPAKKKAEPKPKPKDEPVEIEDTGEIISATTVRIISTMEKTLFNKGYPKADYGAFLNDNYGTGEIETLTESQGQQLLADISDKIRQQK